MAQHRQMHARAYANLNNDLVRDFDTTIKFDRVSSTSRVVDWTASTAYAYNDLLDTKTNFTKSQMPSRNYRLR